MSIIQLNMPGVTKRTLDKLYGDLNRREFVSPDPLQFLYEYNDTANREIVGLIASSLAYGRVAQILKSVSKVMDVMKSPSDFLENSSRSDINKKFRDFRHRFTAGEELSNMLFAAKRAIEEHGSLGACFASGMREADETVLPALSLFVGEMAKLAGRDLGYLLPSPDRGSACKRPNLFLRWMVRHDDVDPGGWSDIPASRLIIPLDTHMHRIGLALGFTRRKQADLRAAMEITEAFRRLEPADPVKYDFSLSRLGIRKDMDLGKFLANFGQKGRLSARNSQK